VPVGKVTLVIEKFRYIECAIYVLVKKKRKKRGKLACSSKGSTNIKDVEDVTLNQVWGGRQRGTIQVGTKTKRKKPKKTGKTLNFL
jgi:hypothetical protein